VSRLRSAVQLFVGIVCGVLFVVACGGGPSKSVAQTTPPSGGSLTCNVPPVTVSPVTCTVPPVTCTVPQAAGPARSAVAGTWSINNGQYGCAGQMHLAGTDASLTGAWFCKTTSGNDYIYGGPVTGDYSGGRLRLNFTVSYSAGYGAIPTGPVFLLDANIASGGTSATGTSSGGGPLLGAFSMALQ
jgi:hypothetical protein